jgi:hypothetical protein
MSIEALTLERVGEPKSDARGVLRGFLIHPNIRWSTPAIESGISQHV